MRARLLLIAAVLAALACTAQAATPETVYFSSADGRTELVGYLFKPAVGGPHAAIVMLHGRAGPYSSKVGGSCTQVGRDSSSPCGARTLSARHESWGEYWAGHGYVALLVDSFGPRGRGHGYGRGTHEDPDREAVNELTVRPLDAQGGLAWLVQRADVKPDRVMLQGWSNGGSTALNAMHRQARGEAGPARFKAALVFYPGCGNKALLARKLQLDAPLWLFLGADDEEVSPSICREVAARSGGPAGAPTVRWFNDATHDFDDPGKSRQAVPGNRIARDEVLGQAAALLDAVP